jgi:glycosyltransferase involved in cell wall biosynthesis
MKLLQLDSIVSPHQMPLAHRLADELGADSFRFATLEKVDQERLSMGWDCSDASAWILRPNEREDHHAEYLRWWEEADVVFCGSRQTDLLEKRIRSGRLTIYYSERWFKPPIGMARLLSPRYLRMVMRFWKLSKSPHFHYFPVGHFAASDMRKIARFGERSRLWGYFTHLPDARPDLERDGGEFNVLYAGRMLDWKRVELLIYAFRTVIQGFPAARLTLIGDGPRLGRLKQLVDSLAIVERVRFLPSMPMKEVWLRMGEADAFVLPSNAYEGWGAVVNEAFTFGSVAVASDATGAGATMIKDGKTGLRFRSGDAAHLAELLCGLARDRDGCRRMAKAAQLAIYDLWSPANAAKRLLEFGEASILGGDYGEPQDGPLSRC